MIPREGTTIADRYRLERKVGGGRVSAVWRVRDEISSRPCAIKILHRSMHKHPEALTRFSLEDRLARELTGPHFPERVGSGVWDGMRYIAWRWHEGESLRALFERNPKQDAPTVHSIVQETCQALSLVHAAGYAHGDLKPENILFADRGEVERSSRQIKLLGFGVASRLARPSAAGFGVSRRRPGELVGTPLYSSPDLILGRVPNGGQADLWALAVIVYEALTGRPPFLGFDMGAVLQAILEKRAPRPSSVADNLPGSFDAWWAQALAQEFDTPSEFAGALARALAPALRTSHTQRSASLPDRAPSALEAMTPMPAPSPRGNASTTASGIGPSDIGLARAAATSRVGKSAAGAGGSQPSAAAVAPALAAARTMAAAPAAVSPAAVSPAAVSPADVSPRLATAAFLATPAGLAAAPSSPAASVSGVVSPAALSSPTALAPTALSAVTSSPAALSPAGTVSGFAGAAVAPAGASSAAPTAATGPAAAVASAVALAPAPVPGSAAVPSGAASAPLTTGVPPLHHEAPRSEPPANDTFAPFPSPLRDLGAEGARKTLVGITPPTLLQSIASAMAGKAPAAAASAAGSPAPSAGRSTPNLPGTRTIEGAPCKPIETADQSTAFDFAAFEASRRPANPTVPFPRPRPVPRTATMPNPSLPNTSDDTPSDIGGRASWHGTTSRTLRFVFTSPDHKPQRVAAILVCAVAALVIFAVGRSPLAGTAGIGQTTGALSADPNPKPASPPPQPASDPSTELANSNRTDALVERDGAGNLAARDVSEPVGDELAPGLVVPRAEAPQPTGPTRTAGEVSPSDTGLSNPPGSAKGHPAAAPPPAAKAPLKKPLPPPPPPPSSLPTPARKNSTELDFGI